MSKYEVYILSLSTTKVDPRPSRLLEYIRKLSIEVTQVNTYIIMLNSVKNKSNINVLRRKLNQLFLITSKFIRLASISILPGKISSHIYTRMNVPPDFRKKLTELIANPDNKLFFVLDPAIAYFMVSKRSDLKIIYEAREFYVGQKEFNRFWNFIFPKTIEYIENIVCKKSMAITTVSEGLSKYIQNRYKLDKAPEVIWSVPKLDPAFEEGGLEKKTFIFHGHVTYDRYIHLILPALKILQEYNLVIRGNVDAKYRKLLQKVISKCVIESRVNFEEPVDYELLLSKTSGMTFGLLPWPNQIKQKQFALPNKFFEYIFSGVPVATVAGSEMAKLVEKENLGIIYNGHYEDFAHKIAIITDFEYRAFLENISLFVAKNSFANTMMKYDKYLN